MSSESTSRPHSDVQGQRQGARQNACTHLSPREALCAWCRAPFPARRRWSRFCGAACRAEFHSHARRIGQPQLALALEAPAARRTDPETSHQAAEHVTLSGDRARNRAIALRLVRMYPGRTSVELARLALAAPSIREWAGWSEDAVYHELARRLPELRDRLGSVCNRADRDTSPQARKHPDKHVPAGRELPGIEWYSIEFEVQA